MAEYKLAMLQTNIKPFRVRDVSVSGYFKVLMDGSVNSSDVFWLTRCPLRLFRQTLCVQQSDASRLHSLF